MKRILVILFLTSTYSLFGQTDSLKQTEQYFEFNAVQRGPNSEQEGYHILVSMGKRNLSKDLIIRKSMVETIQSFYYVEDVLEYMNTMGWTLVTAYATYPDIARSKRFYYIMKWNL